MILRGRPIVLSGTLLLVLVSVTVAACGKGGSGQGHARPTAQAGRPSSMTPVPSPTPTPIAPVEYQAALSAVDAALTPQFSSIFLSGTPADLAKAFTEAATTISTRRSALTQIRPPVNVASAHIDLLAALWKLASDLQGLAGDARRNALCTGGAGIPRAASGSGAQALRQAATEIGTADPAQSYKVGTFLPAGSPDLNRQPANGSLGPGKRGGMGELTINGSSTDAVVKLTRDGSLIRNVYVRAGATVTVDAIPDGTLDAFFTTGTDWDAAGGRFTRDCTFSKFDQSLPYRTNYYRTETQYTTFTLTLYKSAAGNASTSRVDPGSFPAS
ncbi:hypothetical protein [Frankia sp. Cppng1_Ct_nod]|uniref:hypothetical protein n=1 Tax=Frankia sp. Cppng1_Ct_nod TaxID=2897162 RepID=UPI001F5FA42D|nr:hypothetical protein [Frankia sp. Cppng1_Ct_nod]